MRQRSISLGSLPRKTSPGPWPWRRRWPHICGNRAPARWSWRSPVRRRGRRNGCSRWPRAGGRSCWRRPIELKLGATLQKRSPELLQIGSDPSEASATVAKRFWNHSREVVVAMADDPEAVILGSALAAGLDVPILLCEQEEAGAAVSAALEGPVGRADAGGRERCQEDRPAGFSGRKSPAEILPPQALQHRLIAALGADKVRNVVVARAPDDRADVGHTAWLAPYLSSARGAAVVLTHAQAPPWPRPTCRS